MTILNRMREEDPTWVIEQSKELKQTLVHGQGEFHLRTLKWRLENNEKLQVKFEEPKIPYRETITKAARADYRHKKQSGGAGQFMITTPKLEFKVSEEECVQGFINSSDPVLFTIPMGLEIDDSFNSIGTAVMWGRSLYKNIQRFIVFQLTINFVALLIVLLGSMIGTELPLTVTQMLWVNLIMDTFAALALASIPPSETVMQEKPRRSTDFIISKAMRNNILGVGTIFLAVLLGMIYYFDHSAQGMDVHNLTIFFTFFVMLQFWNLFNARVFGTTDYWGDGG